jgi:hypothetical protein
MALDSSVLKSKINTEFTTPIPNKPMEAHAEALAEAYDKYCEEAKTAFGAGLSVRGKSDFKSTFLSVINIPVPTLANYGLAIQSACIAYWGICQFPLGSGIPPALSTQLSIVISPPTPVIGTPIALGLSAGLTAQPAADVIGSSMDIGTKTVTTTHSGLSIVFPNPPTSVGPVPIN